MYFNSSASLSFISSESFFATSSINLSFTIGAYLPVLFGKDNNFRRIAYKVVKKSLNNKKSVILWFMMLHILWLIVYIDEFFLSVTLFFRLRAHNFNITLRATNAILEGN